MSGLREVTLGQLLDEAVGKWPENDAVVYTDRDYRLTYAQFAFEVDRWARGLMALGVQRGEKVAVWATNVPEWVILQFATAKIGAVLLTVNTHYRTHELSYLLTQSEVENLIIIDGFRDIDYVDTMLELVPELLGMQPGDLLSATFPRLKRVIGLGKRRVRGMYRGEDIPALADQTSEADYLARQAELDPHDVVNMQYTSGTTGFPKGVQLTHYNIGNNGYWIGANQHFGPTDRLCLPVPLFHCFGCVLGVLAAVNHGVTMVMVDIFTPDLVMRSIHEEKCTAVYGVPTMFIAMLEHENFPHYDFSSLRTGIMAGSPCPVEVMNRVMERMHMTEITICYGLTEASPVMTQTRIGDPVAKMTGTVGLPMPGIEVRVVDPGTGLDCPVGVQGEVLCRGYNVMKGYYANVEATERAISPEGWLHSGDLGEFDQDGYLLITGRLKDMIIRGGENIYPREIEEFLYTMDGVLDVQVAGVPSRRLGEEVGAFIILRDGVEMTFEDVKAFCLGSISRYKIPKYVAFVESYPMTASGKIQKYKLRELAAELFPEAMQ